MRSTLFLFQFFCPPQGVLYLSFPLAIFLVVRKFYCTGLFVSGFPKVKGVFFSCLLSFRDLRQAGWLKGVFFLREGIQRGSFAPSDSSPPVFDLRSPSEFSFSRPDFLREYFLDP